MGLEEKNLKRADYQRRYCQENREKVAAYQRRYRQENREKVAEGKRRYYQENREKLAEVLRTPNKKEAMRLCLGDCGKYFKSPGPQIRFCMRCRHR